LPAPARVDSALGAGFLLGASRRDRSELLNREHPGLELLHPVRSTCRGDDELHAHLVAVGPRLEWQAPRIGPCHRNHAASVLHERLRRVTAEVNPPALALSKRLALDDDHVAGAFQVPGRRTARRRSETDVGVFLREVEAAVQAVEPQRLALAHRGATPDGSLSRSVWSDSHQDGENRPDGDRQGAEEGAL
jgi:hypothetical protein